MEKNAKTEQYLNEEQLQAITGGCAQCTADRASIRQNQAEATDLQNKIHNLTLRHMQAESVS